MSTFDSICDPTAPGSTVASEAMWEATRAAAQASRGVVAKRDGRKVTTEFIFPPIPVREFDWVATFDDYEPGGPVGRGATEAEAIEDLMIEVDLRDG